MSAIDDLLNKLDAPKEIVESENWIPGEVGDIVAGEIVAFGSNTTDYGTYNILTVKPEVAIADGAQMELADGIEAVGVHLMGAVLSNFFTDNDMVVGGEVAIRYDGKVTSKSGNPYKSFACAYEAPSVVSKLAAVPATGGVLS